MKTIKTAWRNMWRNRGRTIISATAIFVSSLVITLVMSFEAGFIGDMKGNITSNMTGDIRIMNAAYVKNERVSPLQFCLDDTDGLLGALAKDPFVASATPKTDFTVAIWRSGEQVPSRAIGIDFATSRIVTRPANKIVDGKIPAPGTNEILVPTGMAKELGLKPGSKFTAVSRTAVNGTNGKTFVVSGIISIADTDYSDRVFFMDWRLAGDFLRMDGNALQVQVFLKNTNKENDALSSIRRTLAASGFNVDMAKDLLMHGAAVQGSTVADGVRLDVRPWHEVSALFQFFTMADLIYAIIGSIFYLLACTVTFNTTMMSVLERRKEIGTLGALGMEKGKIVLLFLTEGLLISALGALCGIGAGFAIVSTAGRIGFDVNAFGGGSVSGMGFSRIIYPSLSWNQYLFVFLLGIGISFIASYIPSRMAAGVEPADALAER
jgi:putative ABC transport system permease protein